MTYIYGLIDPITNQLRYVGKTVNLRKRWREHRTMTEGRHCGSWVKSLKQLGYDPEIIIIEEVGSSDWKEAEQFWIAYFRFIGADLCNHSNGGEGSHGWHPSAETRAKMSAAKKGKPSPKRGIPTGHVPWNKGVPMSAEFKQKVSMARRGGVAWNRGIPMTVETKQKVSQALLKSHARPEVRKNISIAQRKRFDEQGVSEETREKLSNASKNRSAESIEKQSQSLKLYWQHKKEQETK